MSVKVQRRRVLGTVAMGLLWAVAVPASHAAAQDAQTTLPLSWTIEQVTSGPTHHFYGYDGHVGNTPFNRNGTHLVLLETDFQDRLATASDVARIVLVNLATKAKTYLTDCRGWNFQQGTMMYWNPARPNEEIFFNDRDPATNKLKTVLFNVNTKTRVREFYYSATPFANSGVRQGGGKFLGLNYGRLARLRPVTGYAGAYDWTVGVRHPTNDGIWHVDVATGAHGLLVSFQQLRDTFLSVDPTIDTGHLYINHTLWNRDGTRIIARCTWYDSPTTFSGDHSILFSFKPDGTDIRRFTAPWGHPDWLAGTQLLSGFGKIYEVLTSTLIETVDSAFFMNKDGELGVSRGLNWIVSTERRPTLEDPATDDMRVTFYSRAARAGIKLPWVHIGHWTWRTYSKTSAQSMNRIDLAPCWNRDATKIFFFALAPDGTRQAFVVHLKWIEAESMTLSGYQVETNVAASGGKLIRVPATNPGATASATHTFRGANGTYDIKMWYFDENDGMAPLRLYVNGVLRDSWLADRNLGSGSASTSTRTSRTKTGVALAYGDVIRLEGVQSGSEWARWDSIELIAR